MKYIYIDNYLQLSKKQKERFFKFLGKSQDFKILQQEIIFEEESIILKLENKLNIDISLNIIKNYFTQNDIDDINVQIVKKHISKLNKTILTFVKTNQHILI